jgi:flagellar biosynthesis/type III secretory pathway protein FliH
MRPKSPFLQNLRKKTPSPQMKKAGSNGGVNSPIPKEGPKGFQPFQWNESTPRSSERVFETFAIEPEAKPENKTPEPPPIDVAAEKKKSYEQGYAKAKAEFSRYKAEAERLEKGFQEILDAVQESRVQWVQEVKEGVAESMQTAIHHIAKHPKLQTAILAQKLSEAMGQLAEERELTVFVAPDNVDFARQYVAEKVGWSVEDSTDVGSGAILESSNGVWDARMQVTLDEMNEALTAWMMGMESNS